MTHLLGELKRQEEGLFNCVHCGFCLPVCPTYSRLGDEADSPRGRLHFMRAVVEGRLEPGSRAFHHHLDRCLGCRACESVCPSGVEYGQLLEGAREVANQATPPDLLTRILPDVMERPLLRGPLLALARLLRATVLPRVVAERSSNEGMFRQAGLGMGMIAATELPRFLSRSDGIPESGPQEPASGLLGNGARAGLLLGCVQEGLLSRVNRASARVLRANGFEVTEIPGQGCCGAIHAHTGDLEGARRLARRNIEAFGGGKVDWIAVNAAGCGAIMKEYPHLLADDPEFNSRARDLAGRVRDISELLGRPGLREGAGLPLRVTYDAPCHLLHAQRVSAEPLSLLASVPGLTLIPLEGEEECCGGAGIYGITHPELGGSITEDKVRAILETGAEVVASGNPGCMMQIGAGLRMKGARVDVVHPIELLDESYRRGGLYS